MSFFTFSVRIFIALLMFPFFTSCENLLDISAMFVDGFLDVKLFWIVLASLSSSSKLPNL